MRARAPAARIAIGITLALTVGVRPAAGGGVAIYVDGVAKERLRAAIVGTLPNGTAHHDGSSALRRAAPLVSNRTPPPLARTLRTILKQAATELDAEAVVVAIAKQSTISLLVADADGATLLQRSLPIAAHRAKANQLNAAIEAALSPVWPRRLSTSAAGSPPPRNPSVPASPSAAAPAQVPRPAATTEPASTRSSGAVERERSHSIGGDAGALWRRWNHSLISARLELGVAGRFFTYHDQLTPTLATYTQAVMPMLGLDVDAYPGGHTLVPFVRDLGLFANFWVSLYATTAITAAASKVSNQSAQVAGGLRYRVRFGRDDLPVLGVALGAGELLSRFHGALPSMAAIPAVAYAYLRPALDLRIPISRFALLLNAAYRHLFTSDDIHKFFGHLSVHGVDLGAGVAVALPSSLFVTLSGSYVRMFFDLKPNPGDAYIAGGALDEYYTASLSISYAY